MCFQASAETTTRQTRHLRKSTLSTATRRKKIDPALYAMGWEQVPESEILTEQRAYEISPGQVSALPQNRHPKKADYILEYKKQKLAVIEAKSDEKDVSVGVA